MWFIYFSKFPCKAEEFKDSVWTEAKGVLDNSTRKCSCDTGYQMCPAGISTLTLIILDLLYARVKAWMNQNFAWKKVDYLNSWAI